MKSLSTASHPSYPHFIPQPAPSNTWPVLCFRYLSFIAIVGAWVLFCSTETKLRAILVAFSFSCVEFTFRALTVKHPVGTSIDARGRVSGGPKEQGIRLYWSRLSWDFIKVNGFTTWEQFWGNVFYGPIMNDLYRDTLIPWLPFFTHLSGHWQMMIRAFFHPLNIWAAEIVMGYYLAKVWSRRAWYYGGRRWAFFDGNVTLDYAPFWIGLGLIYELLYSSLYSPIPSFLTSLLQSNF